MYTQRTLRRLGAPCASLALATLTSTGNTSSGSNDTCACACAPLRHFTNRFSGPGSGWAKLWANSTSSSSTSSSGNSGATSPSSSHPTAASAAAPVIGGSPPPPFSPYAAHPPPSPASAPSPHGRRGGGVAGTTMGGDHSDLDATELRAKIAEQQRDTKVHILDKIQTQVELALKLANEPTVKSRDEALGRAEALWVMLDPSHQLAPQIPAPTRAAVRIILSEAMKECAQSIGDADALATWRVRHQNRASHISPRDFDNTTPSDPMAIFQFAKSSYGDSGVRSSSSSASPQQPNGNKGKSDLFNSMRDTMNNSGGGGPSRKLPPSSTEEANRRRAMGLDDDDDFGLDDDADDEYDAILDRNKRSREEKGQSSTATSTAGGGGGSSTKQHQQQREDEEDDDDPFASFLKSKLEKDGVDRKKLQAERREVDNEEAERIAGINAAYNKSKERGKGGGADKGSAEEVGGSVTEHFDDDEKTKLAKEKIRKLFGDDKSAMGAHKQSVFNEHPMFTRNQPKKWGQAVGPRYT